jgi:hypothetical protein
MPCDKVEVLLDALETVNRKAIFVGDAFLKLRVTE